MIGFMVDVALVTAIAHLHLRNSVYNIKGFEAVRSAPSARWRGGAFCLTKSPHSLSPTVLCQIVSVAGDDDADFAFGDAQVTAGSFRLQYEDETTDCIGYVK